MRACLSQSLSGQKPLAARPSAFSPAASPQAARPQPTLSALLPSPKKQPRQCAKRRPLLVAAQLRAEEEGWAVQPSQPSSSSGSWAPQALSVGAIFAAAPFVLPLCQDGGSGNGGASSSGDGGGGGGGGGAGPQELFLVAEGSEGEPGGWWSTPVLLDARFMTYRPALAAPAAACAPAAPPLTAPPWLCASVCRGRRGG